MLAKAPQTRETKRTQALAADLFDQDIYAGDVVVICASLRTTSMASSMDCS
jgi:hypothetical protein